MFATVKLSFIKFPVRLNSPYTKCEDEFDTNSKSILSYNYYILD